MEKEYKVYITNHALEQMEEIKQYIVDELLAPQAARDLLTEFQKNAVSLSHFPARNPLVNEEKWRKKGIRRAVVENFLMYYWINEPEETVYITAVIYGRRDQSKMLEKMKLK